MWVRVWHGRVPTGKAPAYRAFLQARALPDYTAIPGNTGAYILERPEGEVTHFLTVSCWESLEAIHGFAGDDLNLARYYPEDADFLLEFETHVTHYAMVGEA